MYQLIIGFGCGLYVGTYYDCKPILKKICSKIKESIPEKKD